jgi:hypothetical protein
MGSEFTIRQNIGPAAVNPLGMDTLTDHLPRAQYAEFVVVLPGGRIRGNPARI